MFIQLSEMNDTYICDSLRYATLHRHFYSQKDLLHPVKFTTAA